MCFYIESKNDKVLIAKEDITCYKIVKYVNDKEFKACYQNFKYSVDEHYTLKKIFKKSKKNSKEINNGFHSYINENIFGKYPSAVINREVLESRMHSIKIGVSNVAAHVAIKCTIPKGSFYWINEIREEYVSNQIIINEIFFKRSDKKS